MGVINIGVAAHITAAAPGGKRYDALLTPDERRAPKNGIWLCQNCGKLIDSDEITYSVSVLRGWKDQAERRAFEAISGHPKNAVAILERRLSGHTNMVWDVAVTPDGQRIVSASNDESVKVWDSASGAVLFTLTGHESFVCSLSVASNGSQLATGAMDGRIIIWNLFNADCLARLDHGAADAKVSWKPNASVLISGGADGRLCGWRFADLTRICSFSAHSKPILKLACLRDNNRVVSVSADQTVRVCDIEKMQCLQIFEGHSGDVNSVAITQDEKFLVSASGDKTVRIWELDTGECSKVLFGHDEIIWRVAISPDGRILASGAGDDTVRLWDIESGNLLQTLPHPDCIAAVTFNPSNNRLIVGCDDAEIYEYRICG